MSIESVTVRGGIAPWIQAVVEWKGESDNWRLTNTVTQELLYFGTATRYDMLTVPETVYRLELEDDFGTKQPFSYVSPPISAPVEIVVKDITNTSAVLEWMTLAGVDTYEVMIDDTSQEVYAPSAGENPSLALADLIPDRTYAVKIRAFMSTTASLWSPVIHFTTSRTTVVEASTYEYEPSAARTWNPSGWLPDGSQLIHGSGELFNNPAGIHTTVFFYSAETLASIRELAGVRVLTAEISITRISSYSDPRMVLSHWLLHNMPDVPAGSPVFLEPAMGLDSGTAALGQQVWMSIPTGWIDALLTETTPGSGIYLAAGFGWGGVTNRYMLAEPLSDETRPKNGTLQITVG